MCVFVIFTKLYLEILGNTFLRIGLTQYLRASYPQKYSLAFRVFRIPPWAGLLQKLAHCAHQGLQSSKFLSGKLLLYTSETQKRVWLVFS